jgi:hypothetical protein
VFEQLKVLAAMIRAAIRRIRNLRNRAEAAQLRPAQARSTYTPMLRLPQRCRQARLIAATWADGEVRIMGSKSDLRRTLAAASGVESTMFGVRSSIPKRSPVCDETENWELMAAQG